MSLVVTDTLGERYYDVVTAVNYYKGNTIITTQLCGIPFDRIVKFEVTDVVVGSEFCSDIPPVPSSNVVYAGISTSEVINESEVLALSYSEEQASAVGTYDMAIGGYKYFVFPEIFDGPSDFKDNGTADIAMVSSTLDSRYDLSDNGFNYYRIYIDSVPYRVYRTSYIIGTVLTVEIS